mgnify:CR=1 FL=1
MFNCILNNAQAKVVCCTNAADNSDNGAEYTFELSSASTEVEAHAIAREIEGLFSKTETREKNIARIERFLGALDVLYQRFYVVWESDRKNIRDWLSNFCRSCDNDRYLLENVAGFGGVPVWYSRFFVSHAAEMLVEEAVADEKDLKRFFSDDDESDFAQETRRYLEGLEDARN